MTSGPAASMAGWRDKVRGFFTLPEDVDGFRPTFRRRANLYLSRWEAVTLRSRLRSMPTRLVVEPTNVCNLRCPHCHTGAGRFGRRPGRIDPARVRAVLDEIGAYLLLIEFFNWGEALLHPELPEMIALASARGIATRVNTNLSLPYSAADAERLVTSGLTDLFVSIDGATQEVYERYRVGGDLALVRRNCEQIASARARLGRSLPRLTLQYLRFPSNVHEGDAIRDLAAAMGLRLLAFRGAVPDASWGRNDVAWPPWFLTHAPGPCPFLWGQPVLAVDGGIAPCRGVFQRADDVTRLALAPGEPGARTFREAWNHPDYLQARGLFRGRRGAPEDARKLACHDCPTTLFHERWRAHRRAGGDAATFRATQEIHANGPWNYFWARGQRVSSETAPAGAESAAMPRFQK